MGDGNFVGPGVAKIEVEDVAEPKRVLLIPRAIESEGFLKFGDESRIDVPLCFYWGKKVARGKTHQAEDEESDREQHGKEGGEAAKNEGGHGVRRGVQSSSRFQTREPRGGMRMFFQRSFRPT